MSNTTSESQELSKSSDERLQRWFLSPDLREYMQLARDVKQRPVRTGPYVAISRQSGAGGGHIARLVGGQLDWDVLDKELLDFMTQRYSMPRNMLDVVDETKANWFHDVFGSWFDSHIVGQDDYAFRLERIIWLAALHGKVVFVGRGAHIILPRENGLSVRITAPEDYRIARIMKRRNVSQKEAKKLIDETDAGREQFCKRYFHRDSHDSNLYDLVINVARTSQERAVEIIVETYRRISEQATS